MRYVASVEGYSAAVLLKAVELNGRVVLHARPVAREIGERSSSHPQRSTSHPHAHASRERERERARARETPTARCVLSVAEMVAAIGGECVITDTALQKLIVMVSHRLLVPIGRAARACAPLPQASREGSPQHDPQHDPQPATTSEETRKQRPEASAAAAASSAAARGSKWNTNSRRVTFGELYAELKTHILAHLPGRVLGVVACASRKLNSLAINDLLWGFLVARDFGKTFCAGSSEKKRRARVFFFAFYPRFFFPTRLRQLAAHLN